MTAIATSKRLADLGALVTGSCYSVTPEAYARLRRQTSAAHTRERTNELVSALKRL